MNENSPQPSRSLHSCANLTQPLKLDFELCQSSSTDVNKTPNKPDPAQNCGILHSSHSKLLTLHHEVFRAASSTWTSQRTCLLNTRRVAHRNARCVGTATYLCQSHKS